MSIFIHGEVRSLPCHQYRYLPLQETASSEMDKEDMMLLSVPPSGSSNLFSLPYGSSLPDGSANGSINGFVVNEDEDDSSNSCSFPGKSVDVQSDKRAIRKLIIACVLCFVFMCAEFIGGYFANSLAVMTDAAHLFTDFISFIISLIALLLARKGPSRMLTFGWTRAEMLGVLFSVQLIWLVSGVLVYIAIERVRTMDFIVEPKPMIITASLGVIINVIMAGVLHQHVPHAGHGHSHFGSSPETGGSGNSDGHSHSNMNVRAAFIHAVGDLLQSLGVLTAAIIIWFKPEYKLADPICTFIFTVLVIFTTIFIFRDTVVILMESAPKSVDLSLIKHQIQSIGGILHCHNFHVWSLASGKHVCSIHVFIDANVITHEDAVRQCHEILSSVGNIYNITIQTEQLPLPCA